MTSRLDRLFILLETGTNAVTKRAAAEQLGEAQRLHPHELHHLLARVSVLLKSSQWDTRISAAHAVKAIISQVPFWDPEPLKLPIDAKLHESSSSSSNSKLSLQNFDMIKVLEQSLHLTGSEGFEYDLNVAEGDTVLAQDDKILAAKLGLDPNLIGMYSSDLFASSDLIDTAPMPSNEMFQVKMSIKETLQQTTGLSRREMNRARRKARQLILKQRSRETEDGSELHNSTNLTNQNYEPSIKKIKAEDSPGTWYNSNNGTVIDPRCAVPDSTGCWPDSATEWPLEAFADNLLQDLFSFKWEVRHGAATALRELIRLQGQGAGKSRKHTEEEMQESHRQWLIDVALRLLCVLGIDRFGDFISDQVVAPVRETCAQALGSLILMISKKDEFQVSPKSSDGAAEKSDYNVEFKKKEHERANKDIMGLLSIMLSLLEHSEWEARHGALLALKYLLAIRNDLLSEILPKAFPAIMKGLSDSVEDVGAMAASALIPVAAELPKLLDPVHLEAIVSRLWQLLEDQDDLAAACNSFMGLLAAILSLPAARAVLTPQPLSVVLPRLWPFLSHSSSSVRKATLQTLETLTEEGELKFRNELELKERRWAEASDSSSREIMLQEALRHVFERVLIEHVANIQEVAECVWEKLVVLSELELLLHAACPMVSTWLCLVMQPEHVPFNPALLIHVQSQKYSRPSLQQQQHGHANESTQTEHQQQVSSPLKVYIGGVETITQSTRHANVVRARVTATRMLGLLSVYVVKPAPHLVYSPEVPSPSLCYAKVLLAHLHSRSALQRTVAALTMAYWASLDPGGPPHIPDILRRQLFVCLNECIYYDEIAGSVTRLLHECRDYIATLKHYKFTLPLDVNTSGIMTLEQISQVATTPAILCAGSNLLPSGQQQNTNIKLKPKLLESLEDRRRGLEVGAIASSGQQQALHVSTQAALAGAATMLHCLPESPQPLNPLIKPLMESIKREEHEQLQKLAAKHIANLVDLCVARIPCPNPKIATNLCTFLCSDSEFTPRVISSNEGCDPYNGILTLSNRQKHAERQAYNRGNLSGLSGNRGPGRPPATDLPLEEILACEEPEAKASRTRRQGATFALTAIGSITLLLL